VLAPGEMRQCAVQRLVRQRKLGLFQSKTVDIGGIVVEGACIGADSRAPLRVCCLHGHAQHQRPEKRTIQDQPGASRTEFGFQFI